jgi:ketosteroid isomerase-like protein
MLEEDAASIQQALEAAIEGDVDPFVALLAPNLEWRGVQRGHLWWRSALPDTVRRRLVKSSKVANPGPTSSRDWRSPTPKPA